MKVGLTIMLFCLGITSFASLRLNNDVRYVHTTTNNIRFAQLNNTIRFAHTSPQSRRNNTIRFAHTSPPAPPQGGEQSVRKRTSFFAFQEKANIKQSQSQSKPKNYSFNGYIKQMQTVFVFDPKFENVLTDNLIHHRLNFSYYPTNHLTFKAELRDRLIYGEFTKFYNILAVGAPSYEQTIDGGNDALDMSFFITKSPSLYWHVLFDRAFFQYDKGDWQVRAGRQRINWGINTIYNPNDIFNAMNYFDFDYEERPGSDALRITKYTGIASSMELAVKYADSIDAFTGAVLYKTTKKNYDLQSMLGVNKMDLVLGGGWSGYIKEKVGFKGEVSYFQPYENFDSTGTLVWSLGTDFTFEKDWMIMAGVLYNQQESGSAPGALMDFTNSNNISAKKLSTTEWTLMGMLSKPINQRLSWSFVGMFIPENKSLIGINSFGYSIKDNWDISFVSQLFFGENSYTDNYGMMMSGTYLRLKFSY